MNRILVVDDDRDLCALVARSVEAEGLAADCCFSGREALDRLTYQGLVIDRDARTITTARGTFELPPKEFDLLLHCALHQGKILTKAQIYEAVWGEPYVYDDGNIMAVISRLRKKLEPDPSHPTYLQTVKGIGYRFSKDV